MTNEDWLYRRDVPGLWEEAAGTQDVDADALFAQDLLVYGTAYERRHPDGRRERLDPTQVVVYNRPEIDSDD